MTPSVDGKYVDPDQVGEGTLTEAQLLAKENILDHYRKPRNKRVIAHATHRAKDKNPFCGDELDVMLVVEDGVIKDVSFQGQGCAISQASISMLTKKLIGKRVDDALAMRQEDILTLLGIPIGIVRRKCAMLGLRVAQKALGGRP